MPRLTRIYTRTGDEGTTALGGGQRVAKDELRIEAYGTVDELNSQLGVALAHNLQPRVRAMLCAIQNDLFFVGADLCMLPEDKQKYALPEVQPRHIEQLEAFIDELQARQQPLENFILPAGTMGSAQLHVARCVCRRAERCVVTLAREGGTSSLVVAYLNRLSDLLFVMSRAENIDAGVAEVLWDSRR